MVSRWCKNASPDNRKIQTLYSLGVGFVFFIFVFILTKIFNVSLCPVKNFLGISCLGCGMTRGFISILNLDFLSALRYNVLSVPLFLGIVLYIVFSLIDFFCDKNYIYIIESQMSKKYMYLIYTAILIIAAILNNTDFVFLH